MAQRRIPTAFFAELFIHLSLLLGFPYMLDGLEKLAQGKARVRRIPSGNLSSRKLQNRGLKVLHRVYGGQTQKLLRSLAALHADLPRMILEDAYGKVFCTTEINHLRTGAYQRYGTYDLRITSATVLAHPWSVESWSSSRSIAYVVQDA